MSAPFLESFAFTLAITGHRTVPSGQLERIKQQLDDILTQTLSAAGAISSQGQKYSFFMSKPTLRFASCLSAGSDRLGAEMALGRGFGLRAVLPFPLGSPVNAMDLDKEERQKSLAILRELCAKAESVLQLNPAPPKAWQSRLDAFDIAALIRSAMNCAITPIWKQALPCSSNRICLSQSGPASRRPPRAALMTLFAGHCKWECLSA